MAQIDRYVPGTLGEEYNAASLLEELHRIQAVLDSLSDGVRQVLHQEPEKRFEGLIVYADGTDWNPGGGKGFYEFTNAGTNGWRMLSSGVQY